jgi:hypothetical protein
MYEHCEEAGPTLPWCRSRRVRLAALALAAGSRRNRWVCRTAPRSDDLCYNDEYEHVQSREMNTFGPWTHVHTSLQYTRDADQIFYDHQNNKLKTWKLCEIVWWSYLPNEILNGRSCATNLIKFGQITLKRNWRLHQTKLEMYSRNGFTSSRRIFFISNTWLKEPWLC